MAKQYKVAHVGNSKEEALQKVKDALPTDDGSYRFSFRTEPLADGQYLSVCVYERVSGGKLAGAVQDAVTAVKEKIASRGKGSHTSGLEQALRSRKF